MASNIPGVPPPGSGDDRRTAIIATQSVFVALAALCVTGRFISRHLKSVSWGADDWTILVALLMTVAMVGLTIVATNYGIGKHLSDVPPADIVETQKMLYGTNIVYTITPPMVKLSLLLLYRRIFVQQKFVIALWVFGALVAVWMVVVFFTSIFFCSPIAGFWDLSIAATCFDFRGYAIGYAVVNITSDVAIWILPIPIIWGLHLGIGQKAVLTSIFLLGLFVWAASFVRLFTSVLALDSADFTYTLSNGYIWSIIEPSVGIICACLPTMRIFLNKLFPSSLGSSPSDNTAPSKMSMAASRVSKTWPKTATYAELDSDQLRSLDPTSDRHDAITLAYSGGPRTAGRSEMGGDIRVEQEISVEGKPRRG